MSTATAVETLRAAASAAHARDPLANTAKSPDPTSRDLQIFKLVAIEHFTHAQVAKRFDITRSRVTQVIKQVRATLAGSAPKDAQIADHFANQRLETHLQRQRLQHVLAISARALRETPQPLSTTRSGHKIKGGEREEWAETITRQQPQNLQALKTYLRATEALGKLSHRETLPDSDAENLTQEELFHAVQAVLHDWIRRLAKEPNKPNDAFIALVKHFQWCLFSWLYHRRQGTPPAEITLPPFSDPAPAPNPDLNPVPDPTLAPAPNPSTPNPANHPDPEPNHDLTSEPSPDFDTSPYTDIPSDAPDSFPYDEAPTAPPLKKSEKVSATSPHLQNPKSPIPNPKLPPHADSFEARLARRLAHERKVEQYRDAMKSGLPFMIEWDHQDGPPPPISHHLDDYGYQPSPPPTKEEDTQMVKDYLAKLRAQRLANA